MNPIRKLHLYSLVLIFTLLLSRTQPTVAITIDELADICQTMESAHTDITVEYEFGVGPQSTIDDIKDTGQIITLGPCHEKWITKRPFSERVLYSKHGKYMNEDGQTFEQTMIRSYNGKIVKYFSYLSPQGITVDAVITESTCFLPASSCTPGAYSIFRLSYVDGNGLLSEHLRKKESVRIDESVKQIEGFNVVCVELLWDAPNVPILHKKEPELRVYFSVDHGYTPVKYEYMTHTGTASEPRYATIITSLEKVDDGLWFPSKGYYIDLSDNLTNTYKATRIVVNQGLTDEYFDIEFPPGTRITNEISGLSYVSEAPEDQNDTGTNSTIQDSKPSIEVQRPQTPTDTQKSNKMIIYISIAAVIVLLSALIVKKSFYGTG